SLRFEHSPSSVGPTKKRSVGLPLLLFLLFLAFLPLLLLVLLTSSSMEWLLRPLLLASAMLIAIADARCECAWQHIVLRDAEDYRTIASPDYPRNYCAKLDCSWLVVSSINNSRIIFSSSSIDLRDGDEVRFYSSRSRYPEQENAEVVHVCTSEDTSCEFSSPSSYVAIRFVTSKDGGRDQSHLGFHATLTASGKSSLMTTLLSYSLHLLLFGLLLAFLISLCVFLLCCCQCSSSPSKEMRREEIRNSRLL
ncbi:hypothetical protein PENTCL1PPCAC_362, partial [Pristionchus entomophagus]